VAAARSPKDNPLPPAVELAQYCERYDTLPGPGALLDQDYRELHIMSVLSNIYAFARNVSDIPMADRSKRLTKRQYALWLELARDE